jgi:hypothetical protein
MPDKCTENPFAEMTTLVIFGQLLGLMPSLCFVVSCRTIPGDELSGAGCLVVSEIHPTRIDMPPWLSQGMEAPRCTYSESSCSDLPNAVSCSDPFNWVGL